MTKLMNLSRILTEWNENQAFDNNLRQHMRIGRYVLLLFNQSINQRLHLASNLLIAKLLISPKTVIPSIGSDRFLWSLGERGATVIMNGVYALSTFRQRNLKSQLYFNDQASTVPPLIHHLNGTFRKRSSHRWNLNSLPFLLVCAKNILNMRLFENDDVTKIMCFP